MTDSSPERPSASGPNHKKTMKAGSGVSFLS